jgi:hypothetical protein
MQPTSCVFIPHALRQLTFTLHNGGFGIVLIDKSLGFHHIHSFATQVTYLENLERLMNNYSYYIGERFMT